MDDERPTVDGTRSSPAELRAQVRAQVRALQDGHDEDVAEARTELVASLAQLDQGLRALRTRVVGRARQVAAVGAVGLAVTGAAVVAVRRLASSV
jgi:hypothetical protein